MASSDGWYLVGPLAAVTLVGLLAAALRWSVDPDADWLPDPYADGLAIFDDDDYGLLCPAAATEDLDVADEVRRLLAEAGIRATYGIRPDGRIVVLVFAEVLEEARRLVGGSPAV